MDGLRVGSDFRLKEDGTHPLKLQINWRGYLVPPRDRVLREFLHL
jgi:hypothetical protein